MGRVLRTPLQPAGRGLLLKREDLQIGGSFKMRGAVNSLRTAPLTQRRRGVVCASSGNTGLALAMLNNDPAIPTFVFASSIACAAKVAALRELGVRIVRVDGDFPDAASAAQVFAADHGMLYCSSGSEWEFIYGNATVGIELTEQCAVLDEVYVPIGGGGLAAGVGLALSLLPSPRRPRLVGVELYTSCPVHDHLTGRVTAPSGVVSIAGCLDGGLEAGAVILKAAAVLDEVVLVSDDQLRRAQRELAGMGVEVDAGPAAAYAGYMSGARPRTPMNAAVLISGGR